MKVVGSVEWSSLIITSVFNVSDTLGRVLGGVEKLMVGREGVLIHVVCVSRVFLILSSTYLFLTTYSGPVISWLAVLNTAAMGLSNGYVQTLTMIYAPSAIDLKSSLTEDKKRE